MLEKSKIKGVTAGVLCWWIDKGVTMFLPIELLSCIYERGEKSVRFDFTGYLYSGSLLYHIKGTKKRVFFEYDMQDFLDNGVVR